MASRVAQSAVEVLAPDTSGIAKVAQAAVEVLAPGVPGDRARTAQVAVEVLHSLNAFVPVSGGSGAWFKVLEGDIYTDRDLVD